MNQDLEISVDALIVGGGPAGLSCALTLARSGRYVALCDDGFPRNAKSQVMNNFPGLDGINPADFLEKIRQGLLNYPEIESFNSTVLNVAKIENGFKSLLFDGRVIHSNKLVLAEGLVDSLPDISGMVEGWGKSIFQCTSCHAYEQKDKGIGILANEHTWFHVTKFLLGLTSDLIIFTNGKQFLTQKQKDILDFRNITIVEEPIDSLVMEGSQLTGVRLMSGEVVERKALFIRPESRARSNIGIELGCELDANHYYITDENCRSNISGVYIAGDVSSSIHSVLFACAEGAKAGAFLNMELLEQEFENLSEGQDNHFRERGTAFA